MNGLVESIFVCARGGALMQRVGEVDAVAGGGFRGDRYMERTGYWTGVDECQATLIQAEMLEEIASDTGIAIGDGEHRRNIVTRGVSLDLLVGRRFRIGDVLFEYDRPRPPCGYIQKITERGMTRALGGARGGICARVIEGGRIHVNDELVLSE
jgi:MOSC domain-containing protein YiiM